LKKFYFKVWFVHGSLILDRNQPYWKIDKILERNDDGNGSQLLIKWTGFIELKWQNAETLVDIADLLYKYGYEQGHVHWPKV
jgi:hypothetical protein